MAEVVLVNRTRFTSSLKNELLEQFDQLARETRIPKSRLFDEAIEDLLKKYALTMGETGRLRLLSPFFPCAGRGDVLE